MEEHLQLAAGLEGATTKLGEKALETKYMVEEDGPKTTDRPPSYLFV